MAASPKELAETYITALHAGDTDTLRSMFIEQSSLYGLVEGELAIWPREVWLERVAGRQSGKEAGEPREGEVISIDHLSEDNAVIKLSVTAHPRKFLDFLNVIKVGDEWKVVNKCFHTAA